jgi:hypothetical protein
MNKPSHQPSKELRDVVDGLTPRQRHKNPEQEHKYGN